jgi:hypothetical protein
MTWKRCEGCTRAIASVALTCEYCGRACGDGLTGPPTEVGDRGHDIAWPPHDLQSTSPTSNAPEDSPQGLRALELDTSFPFTEVDDEPLREEPTAEAVSTAAGPFFLDEELEPVTPAAPSASVAHEVQSATAAAPAAKKSVGPRQMAMLGGALVAASGLIFTILSMRPSASPEPTAQAGAAAPARGPAANRAPSGASRTAGAPASSPRTPKWSQVTGGRWTGGDKKSVAFELQASNRIQIWTRDVTPLLIVRCRGGQVEPFVYTQSAARMEAQDGDHTVRVAFDDGPEVTDRWPDSDEHDALFAKDATAFANQLATAQTLRFGFEPHNAPPASAQFDVSGIAELLAAAAKPCGWKPVANR